MAQQEKGLAVVIGAGPGLGASLAARLAREGHPVALISRTKYRLDDVADVLRESGATVVVAEADAAQKPAPS